jgi:hypothetical protein
MDTTRRHLAAIGTAALGLAAAMPRRVAAQGTRPLIMPGKRTLFQRVLVRPGASLAAQAGGSPREALRTFSLFYVFDRRTAAGAEWLQIGGRNGPPVGWLPAERSIPWKQTIVVGFSNPAGRERSLLFRNTQAIEQLMGDATAAASLRERAARAALRPDDQVVAIEPEKFVDIRKQFYLLPILDRKTILHKNREVLALRVASVASPPATRQEVPPQRPFRAGIVFVIDTTISMQPYIERTHEAVRQVYQRIQGSAISQNVSFGLVGYRNSISRTPGLEYLTRTFVSLMPDQNPRAVLDSIASVRQARVSSHDLREDAYAGVNEAIEKMDWEPFAGRYVILITDSGPMAANDPLSSTRLDATALNDHARSRGISLATLHLITQVNRPIYPEALPALRTLCSGIGSDRSPRYFPILNGSPSGFSEAVNRMTSAMLAGLEAAAQNQKVVISAAGTGDELAEKTLTDTLAMQLAYLGRQEGERAPDVVEGWLADRALEKPDMAAVNVQVLMTKNQLSTLRSVLASIIDQGERTSLDSTRFFAQVRSALAAMARDPERLASTQSRTVGEAMDAETNEFLEDLTYPSEILYISSDDWVAKSRAEQREILDRLAAKLRAFDRFHDDPALWTALQPGDPPGETVFPLPLSSLP